MDIANNLWWCWNPEAINLLRRIDSALWKVVYHNPKDLIGAVSQERLKELSEDESFLAHLDRVLEERDEYYSNETWFESKHKEHKDMRVAYFSFEFGLDESLPIYSGGLGILAGDHLKSASDIGTPLTGVSLLYSHGYFQQYLNIDGWQQEHYPENDFSKLPIELQKDENGEPLLIDVALPNRTVYAQVWVANVARVPLVLLDTNIKKNSREDREITTKLYGGDIHMRMKQEILLGMGGVKALKALNMGINVFHMNEGHAAFMILQRIHDYMKESGFSFHEAAGLVQASSLFTTHTPVPAGIDIFDGAMIDSYFSNFMKDTGVSHNDFMAMGEADPDAREDRFSMAVFAIKHSLISNGVSKLHGEVSRKMWNGIWKGLPENEVPITSITNGIHISTWISHEMRTIFDRYLGPNWKRKPGDKKYWERLEQVPFTELWRTHERRRERLVDFARKRVKKQLEKKGAGKQEFDNAEEVLDPDALTIGFARRFATYKRGNLIFSNLEKLAELLNNKERPVQIIFAGKAHPRDEAGKTFIKEIVHHMREPEFRNKIVFIEDYDMNVGRYLVQGVDVWLNNPMRPHEASGTSGMKAGVNGALNLSILDGWWDEGYNGLNGWAIGHGEEYSDDDLEYQNEVESKALYDLLEEDVIPTFYDRGRDGMPRQWLQMMKDSMGSVAPNFNTNRMVRDYTDFYVKAHAKHTEFVDKEHSNVKDFASLQEKIKSSWNGVSIVSVKEESKNTVKVGESFKIDTVIHTGSLSHEELSVEIYYGHIDQKGEIPEGSIVTMTFTENEGNNAVFSGEIACNLSGEQGYAVRVRPKNSFGVVEHLPKLLAWS